jgi:hypothetical protein
MEGYEVYDFRNPAPDSKGFAWSEIARDWLDWTPREFMRLVTEHPVAAKGFAFDKAALDWCDTCVLVLPSGRSAHLEAGYAAGQGKQVVVLLHEDRFEPELMYLLCQGLVSSIGDLLVHLRHNIPRTTTTTGFSEAWRPLRACAPQRQAEGEREATGG